MKRVEYWLWTIWNLQGTKKVKTRHHMDEVTALARHPEAVRVPGSCEVRQIPETPEERAMDSTSINTRAKLPG